MDISRGDRVKIKGITGTVLTARHEYDYSTKPATTVICAVEMQDDLGYYRYWKKEDGGEVEKISD